MFIVIDGIDGSGKGTQVLLLKESLEKMGKSVKILDFPRYGKESAYFVEQYLNGEYGEKVDPKLSSLFYAFDRFNVSKEIQSDLGNYDFIISNRYVSASMIHQAGKIKDEKEADVFLEWLDNLEYSVFSIPRPDTTIFLDVPPHISAGLITSKEQRSYIKNGENKDLHEKDPDHLQNAYKRAHYVADKFKWVCIECTVDGKILPKEIITQKILSYLL